MPKPRTNNPESASVSVIAVFDQLQLQIGNQAWNLTTGQARQLAEKLNEAADHADGYGQDDEEEDDEEDDQ